MKHRKNILYIEANQDGSIGGSHYCLLEIVKHVNKEKYLPVVYFYEDNKLAREVEKYCKVIIAKNINPLVAKKVFPGLYDFCEKNFILKKTLAYLQKIFNFIKCDVIFFIKIVHVIRKTKTDIIHLNNGPMSQWLIAAKLLRIKCIAHTRGDWSAKTPTQIKLFKHYDRVISISDSVASHLRTQVVNIENLVRIYDGIDIDAVSKLTSKDPVQLRKELNLLSSDLLVGLVGNIKEWKGQHVAIEAMRILKEKYPNIRLLIVGDVSNEEKDQQYHRHLKNLVDKYALKENVLFLGYRKDIPDLIVAIDVLIHTSTEPEPLGRVVLEGMLFEKPVIASNHGGPAEILDNGITGYLTKPGDENELSKQISYVLSNLASSKEIGTKARKELKEKFDIGKNVEEIENIYASLLV